jgi:hypothetical protein
MTSFYTWEKVPSKKKKFPKNKFIPPGSQKNSSQKKFSSRKIKFPKNEKKVPERHFEGL